MKMVFVGSISKSKLILLCILCSLIITILISLSPINVSNRCDCNHNNDNSVVFDDNDEHKLAVIVPFRDRFDELTTFVPHLHQFLVKQNIDHKILIINQVDFHRFNRGSLINVGFLLSRNQFDYIAMHDVDLIPLNPQLKYEYPKYGPFHVSSPHLHPKYHYKTFVGGILLITREHFEKLNGLSNKYWGWGLEDDEFYARIKEAGLMISRPEGILTGFNDSFVHFHDRSHRKRDTARLFNQKEVTRRRDRQTGLNTVQYNLVKVNEMTIDKSPFTVYHVKLICDKSITPWCDMKYSSTSKPNIKLSK